MEPASCKDTYSGNDIRLVFTTKAHNPYGGVVDVSHSEDYHFFLIITGGSMDALTSLLIWISLNVLLVAVRVWFKLIKNYEP